MTKKKVKEPKTERDFSDVKNPELRKALAKAGGYPQLGKALGVSRQAVHGWETIPDRLAPKCEELFGIPREKIAPHLYN